MGNAHMGDPQHGFAEGESGFEGIFHDKTQDGMYVVREAVDISGEYADDTNRRRLGLPPVTDHPKYHAIVMQILLPPPDSDDTDYAVLDSCPSEMLLTVTRRVSRVPVASEARTACCMC